MTLDQEIAKEPGFLAMLTEKTFEHQGVSLNYAVGPSSGPPLLLFHGITRLWQDYVPLIPVYQGRWQILAIDWRGHGRSSRHPGQYLVMDYVQDAIALIETVCKEPVTIHGHSLGALVAAGVAARIPDRVRGIILEDPPAAELIQGLRDTPFHAFFTGWQRLAAADLSVAERTQVMANMILPAGVGQPPARLGDIRDLTLLRLSSRCLRDLDPAVLDPLLHGGWLQDYDQPAIMASVKCPTLFLRSDMSLGGMMPVEIGKRLAATMRDCLPAEYPGTGHAIHWLALEKISLHSLAFLESLR